LKVISPKQKKILAFPYSKYDAIICDGAVRSGKTSLMMWAFVSWAMENFSGQSFGICGKTVDSCTKNIIVPFTVMTLAKEKYTLRWRSSHKILEVRRGAVTNYFEVFGGKDESSYTLIQGRTLAGVLLDEVVLMPRSFVEQALTRCSVDGAKLWFSCNPDNPMHWFYTDWIKRARERNALYLHFEMTDNPGLSQKTLERYQTMFSGVFYDRYVRGKWCVAEGLVYDFGEEQITDDIPQNGEYYISVDYGTLNPFSAGLWCIDGGKAVRIAEYYYSGRDSKVQKTDEDYCDAIIKLAGGKPVRSVIVDPSAASFITALRRRGNFSVREAKNDVLDGIRLTYRMLKNGQIKINKNCKDAIREFGLYRWDDKSTTDKPIKENDHAMDDIRYFANTILRRRFKVDRLED
jgi:PBSX family phage terminase large subunit